MKFLLLFVFVVIAKIADCHPINENGIEINRRNGNVVQNGLRCGNLDIENDHLLGNGQPYSIIQKRNNTFTLLKGSKNMVDEDVIEILQETFDIWGYEVNLIFTYTTDPDADIKISFVEGSHIDPWSFDGPGGVLAHTFHTGHEGYPGLMHFDDAENWFIGFVNDSQIDFYSVTLHEIGHMLGLPDSPNPDRIMHGLYVAGRHNLHEEDIREVRHLYQSV